MAAENPAAANSAALATAPRTEAPAGAEHGAPARHVHTQLLARMGEAHPEPRLDATRLALELLGDPHTRYPVLHLTGTNGKTSTSRIAESLLRASGARTGLFTSPHLIRFNERIVIEGEPISDGELDEAWRIVGPALATADATLAKSGRPPLTYFEAITVLAFHALATARVDAAVIEVGMGGLWDSTNVADGRVAVFTPIALDHTRQLGRTVSEIASTKAGIIKPGARVVSATQSVEVGEVLAAAAAERGASMVVEGRDFAVVDAVPVPRGRGQLVRFAVDGAPGIGPTLLPLLGRHQAQNAAVALSAVRAFLDDPSVLTPAVIADGLARASSPGRLERVGSHPALYVDAAHNPAGAEVLARAVAEVLPAGELAIVLGILDDKDAQGIVATLAPLACIVFATRSASDRALDAAQLAALVRDARPSLEVFVCEESGEALAAARQWGSDRTDRAVLVTGSITLVGDVLKRVG